MNRPRRPSRARPRPRRETFRLGRRERGRAETSPGGSADFDFYVLNGIGCKSGKGNYRTKTSITGKPLSMHGQKGISANRAIWSRSTPFKNRQERFACDPSGPNEIHYYVLSNFFILGHDKRPSHSGLFKLDMAPFLPGHSVAKFLKHANDFFPRKWR